MANQSLSKLFMFSLLLLGAALLFISPDVAFAAAPFQAGGNTMKSDIISMITPVIGLGIVVLGLLCAFGKVNWGWLIAAIFGVILVYGHEQIISWVRSAFGI